MGRQLLLNVKVSFSGIDFSQDVRPLILEFYPGAEVMFSAVSDDSSEDASKPEDYAGRKDEINGFGQDDLIINFITLPEMFSIELNGKTVCEKEVVFGNGEPVFESELHLSTEKLRHRDYRNQIMKALYEALSKLTGRTLPWGSLTGVRPAKLCFERLEKNMVGNISHLIDTYCCSPQKAGLAQMIAGKELKLLREMDYKNGYSLYVGFPFCPSICNYCSFGSHPMDRFGHLAEPYIEALLKEIDGCSGLFPELKLETVYFGGGTPTAVTAEQLKRVIDRVRERFDFGSVLEFSVEAGRPDSIDAEKLQVLKDSGVTRISINPQTMRQRTLDLIGRRHTAEQTVEAFRLARSMGFDNINMDLIAGLSGENAEDMKYTLDEIGKLDPESITVHTLALKRAARLTTEKESFEGLEASEVSQMVEYARSFCTEHGYEPYYLYRQKNMTDNLENVGYAKPGREGLYNILIMEEQQTILALGAGGSSKFPDYRFCLQGENASAEAENGIEEPGRVVRRFGRVENVKSVVDYIGRIDEMIERKRIFLNK